MLQLKMKKKDVESYEKLRRDIISQEVKSLMLNYPRSKKLSRYSTQIEKIRKQEGQHVDKLNDMKLKIGC